MDCPDFAHNYDTPNAADLTLVVTDPEVLGYLLGPDGAPIATLLDRPLIPFGFQRTNPG